ncbi:ABC transporter substrate-binding protein [Leucobacter sp. M11]|uniref:ABC transporter substrate-binding protein n=1 Tax=Leucobacter sp. M11 TaxID=2993565 RepID=UPI002D804CCB|nr:ABC transporter substrate-binding protein [Leucobacter sp. M11]MEB4614984.1 ABC transporter substrate-binding protein [Leucobacter sp. M11]
MKMRTVLPAIAAAAILTLSACSNAPADPAPSEGTDTSPSTTVGAIEADPAAVALLPAAVKDSGTLIIGTDAAYPPNEYKDKDGKPIGWGVDLANAVSAKLGLETDWRVAKFENIIPSITGGKMQMGSSSFTDNLERQKAVDFVNFYDAGILWATAAGNTVDPDNACGLKVAVQTGTVQDTEDVPAKSDACVAAGKEPIEKLKYEAQEEATNAVVLGKADAMSADSPITLYAIAQLDGKLEVAGKSFDTAPYGFATEKDSDMTKAIQAALQSMMDDGTYLDILSEWGVEDGAIDSATVNAGNS